MDISQNNGASPPPAEEQVQRAEGAAVGGNPGEGNPSAGSMAPQAQTQTAQNTAQGDAATPLETGLRQHGDTEKQGAVEAKAAREAALANINRERRQKGSETPRSSSNALVQAWICYQSSKWDRSRRRPQRPAASPGTL
jgi:hypothetical protein